MGKLSEKARELLEFLRKDYKQSGYMYSGSWPYESLTRNGFEKEVIHELQEIGLLQRRDCDDYAFELSAEERGRLITGGDLCSVWYEKGGDALLAEIQNEVRDAADVVESSFENEKNMVSVRTLKVEGDSNWPDRIKVPCAFSVGQVVSLEYDKPKKLQRAGYHLTEASDGKAVGQFMVTDVIHNLLVKPGMNLLEVQSLCDEFNKFYPHERTMVVFEDDLMARTIVDKNKQILFSLDGDVSGEIGGFSHELSEDMKEKMGEGAPKIAVADYSQLSVEELVEHATEESRILNKGEKSDVKVLNFVDDIGFTQFSVDAGWYEKQVEKNDVAALFEKASFDDASGFKDITGKCLEPEM